jgi:cytochrome c oxidase subunit 3
MGTETVPLHRGKIDRKGKTLGMWFFLFTELLFFGGLFLLYSVYRYRFSDAFHKAASGENLVLGTLNTFLLLTSSFTMTLAIAAIKRGRRNHSVILQSATIALGIAFLIIKFSEWGEKISAGIYPKSPVLKGLGSGEELFFGLYYVMTGLHGLHVFVGIIVIAVMTGFTLRRVIREDNPVRLENTGLYWHFVDIVWLYLFPLFYLVT